MNPTLVLRSVALFDLALTLPMAVPVLSDWYLALLFSAFGALGRPAEFLPLPMTTALFCNLSGILAVVWNGYRAKYPRPSVAKTDAGARLFVAALLMYYLLVRSAPVMLWLFVLTELGGSVIQWRTLNRIEEEHHHG